LILSTQEAAMENSVGVTVGVAALAVLAIAAVAWYRWRMRERARRINLWVKDFLVARYGTLPHDLHINCSDDELWPVLVSFTDGEGGTRHDLQFSCPGPVSSFRLSSEV
jgi:hypothetical protein